MGVLARIVAGLALGLALGGAATAPTPEPSGYWTGPMHGTPPAGLTGAAVLDAEALTALIAKERPLLLDVAAEEVRPSGMAAEALWRPIHRSVPGSIWMPGAGDGVLSPSQEALLLARIRDLTKGEKARPIVAFCHRDCWASWNAAKRLVRAGYSRVYWFPEGVEGWQDLHEPAVVTRDETWAAAMGRAS
jgi:PQQ-dependent catabolism-associated CXXCW motif protein